MKKNMGGIDRALRVVVAVAIGVLYFTGVIGGVLAIILGIVAFAFLVTGLAGRCPGYLPLKLSTKKRPAAPGA